MEVRFVENANGKVEVQARVLGNKWNKNRKPIKVSGTKDGWEERLRRWARRQGHTVIEAE